MSSEMYRKRLHMTIFMYFTHYLNNLLIQMSLYSQCIFIEEVQVLIINRMRYNCFDFCFYATDKQSEHLS